MDKYYSENELMQRTSKNDSLYDELYREKQTLSDNMVVLNDADEIDINKIKSMIDSRENYKRAKKFEDVVSPTKNNKDDYDKLVSILRSKLENLILSMKVQWRN